MQLGSGISLKLDVWERGLRGPRVVRKEILNKMEEQVWLAGYDPIWQVNGVWEVDREGNSQILQPEYFCKRDGRKVDFNRDYYVPFNNQFAVEIRKIQPEAMIFIEKGFRSGGPNWCSDDADNVVYAPHWYDPVVLVLKSFNRWINYDRGKNRLLFGPRRIAKSFTRQLKRPKDHARTQMGDVPTLIGEVGIAYDLDEKKAYDSGDFSAQIKAFDRTIRALEENLHHFTLWNYAADNRNDRGDKWNDEDLSIFSRDQQDNPVDIHSGGRALEALVRPYPMATAGEPLKIKFDVKGKVFDFMFQSDPAIEKPTLIYIPNYQYPDGFSVDVSGGSYRINRDSQI